MSSSSSPTKFGTFAGVFTPTAITILGVIMYLRQAWVVGNAGLLGSWLIIGMCVFIASTTAFSLSSIATNTRLHAGGAYAIISRSLGLEAGACIGFALYIAQAFSITMYIFGFREGWLSIFPNHIPFVVDILTFIGVFAVALFSSSLATRVQYFVLAVTALSIACVAFGPWNSDPTPIRWWGEFEGTGGGYTGFWKAFAVFFPAVTGVMAGANMSGDLENPKKSIPQGTIGALIICTIIYFYLSYIQVQMAPPQELLDNTTIMIDQSWSPAFMKFVVLCATASSALATFVGSPRILQALAKDGSVPKGGWLAKISPDGEPRNAILVTGCIAIVALFFRDLNVLAPLITIFFLSTYAAVNGVVVVEQGLGLVNFRPRLRLSLWVPLSGSLSSLLAMLIINPSISVLSISSMLLLYAILSQGRGQKKEEEQGDVRGNIFVALARWFAREAQKLPKSEARAWVPSPLCPIGDEQVCRNALELAGDIAYPRGQVKLLRITKHEDLTPKLSSLEDYFIEENIRFASTVVQHNEKTIALLCAMQTLRGEVFAPNILSIGSDDGYSEEEIRSLTETAQRVGMGIVLRCPQQRNIGQGGIINIWIRPQKGWNIEDAQREGNLDLAILVGFRLSQRHKMRLRLITTLHDESENKEALYYLHEIIDVARLPERTDVQTVQGNLFESVAKAPKAAVNIFGLPNPYQQDFVDQLLTLSQDACLFVKSSGNESVLI
jgi:solute carrier family 12 (sodium/potassium/chloride transporter), member 2